MKEPQLLLGEREKEKLWLSWLKAHGRRCGECGRRVRGDVGVGGKGDVGGSKGDVAVSVGMEEEEGTRRCGRGIG